MELEQLRQWVQSELDAAFADDDPVQRPAETNKRIMMLGYLRDAVAELEYQATVQKLSFRLVEGRWLTGLGYPISAPRIEKLPGDRTARLVVDMSMMIAEEVREKFGLHMVPAGLDATDAIVRATHELAGATIELGKLMADLRAKL